MQENQHYMGMALRYARLGLGLTAPNPSVGCVVVQQGQVVGYGSTGVGGTPHAEVMALAQAGGQAKGATVYVTLEPCCHHGKTPPCVEAVIEAAPARVVVAMEDPNPRVTGGGIRRLQEAGIVVELGVCAQEAAEVLCGFATVQRLGRPMVTVKMATSLDGRIATAAGESQWITGRQAREYGHLLRAQHDAIMIGGGTLMADQPQLTCRLPGLAEQSPIRVVLDRQGQLVLDSALVRSAREVPLWWVVDGASVSEQVCDAMVAKGVEVVRAAVCEERFVLADVLAQLAERGITRLLVEGGGQLWTSFLQERLVDRLVWMRAPLLLGDEGRPAVGALGVDVLVDAWRGNRRSLRVLGEDLAETYDFVLA